MATELSIRIEGVNGTTDARLVIGDLVIAGWTSRDMEAMEHHIAELEAMGISRPSETPMFYRVAAARLTTAASIDVSGGETSGEVEFVMAAHQGQLLVGLGSDHTDRKLETHGVTWSKQACDKPIARSFWAFSDVRDHWDRLILRSHATIDGQAQLYQEGTLAAMLPPEELLTRYQGSTAASDGLAMFGGTFPAIGGVRPARRFSAELEDPVLGRRISFEYEIKTLPIVG